MSRNHGEWLAIAIAIFLTGIGMIMWPHAMVGVEGPSGRRGQMTHHLIKTIWSVEGGWCLLAIGIAVAAVIIVRSRSSSSRRTRSTAR